MGKKKSSVSRLVKRGLWAATRGERAYLQGRLVLFSRAALVSLVVYQLVVIVARIFLPETRTMGDSVAGAFALAAIVMLAAAWRYAAGPERSPEALALLDVAVVMDLSLMMSMGGYVLRDVKVMPFGTVLGVALLVVGRTLVIPSRYQRTAIVSTLAILPALASVIALAIYHPQSLVASAATQVTFMVAWLLMSVGVASYGSAVIYGLRKQVQQARQLGQYTLGKKLGEGGMGSVYRARHAMLRRPTAVKLLPPDKAGEDQLRRFEREVQVTAELTHPNTIAIYDYGRSPDGMFYYAMEYLDGVDLQSLVESFGPQPVGRVIHILQQVCGALAEAHGRGLVHRDIKPANIFVCERGGISDMVKVLDFGLVRELEPVDGGHTIINAVAGTPMFMAPEAITDPGNVGPLADVYSLAAVAYLLVSGQPVFDGKTVVEVCSHHVHREPTPPSEKLGAPLPKGFEQLLLRCLAKAPEERVESAEELRQVLARLAVTHPWKEEDAERWWERANAALAETSHSVPGKSAPTAGAVGLATTLEVQLGERDQMVDKAG